MSWHYIEQRKSAFVFVKLPRKTVQLKYWFNHKKVCDFSKVEPIHVCHSVPGTVEPIHVCHSVPGIVEPIHACNSVPGTVEPIFVCNPVPGTVCTV